MSGLFVKFAGFLLTCSLCVSGTALAQKGAVRKRGKKPPKQEQPAPALPAYTPAPLQPLPLEQVPAVAPRVHYEAGKLTIVAHNSTLSDVLNEVKEQTGAELDIPSNANERVVADLGPGPARAILAELLNGTHFNYVMVGSITDPTAIQSIVLTPRTAGSDTTTTAANRPGGSPRVFAQPAVINAAPADVVDNDASEDADVADDPPPTEQADQQNQQTPAQQTPKTPEQLLQELQRQQQQVQQQQQGQNPGQPPPPGLLPNQPPTGSAPTPNGPNKPE
jgi:hypothetical protein